MAFTTLAAIALLAQGAEKVDVAFDDLTAGENLRAIAVIEANEDLEAGDPARLINLGIAHARTGNVAEARALFEAAATSEIRYSLETASGRWVDSRYLALEALQLLDNGEFLQPSRMAQR